MTDLPLFGRCAEQIFQDRDLAQEWNSDSLFHLLIEIPLADNNLLIEVDKGVGIDRGSLHELIAGIIAFNNIGGLDSVGKENRTTELDVFSGLVIVNGEGFGLRKALLRLSVMNINDRSSYGK